MQLKTSTSITIPRPREVVFDYATLCETLVETLRPFGPVAGLAGAEMLDGRPLETGAKRRITMSDGAVLIEDILEFTRPNVHRYRWTTGLKPPFAWLVKSGEGVWIFREVEQGTRIDWNYTFELSSPLAAPLAAPIMLLFKQWQARGLQRIRAQLIEQSATAAAH